MFLRLLPALLLCLFASPASAWIFDDIVEGAKDMWGTFTGDYSNWHCESASLPGSLQTAHFYVNYCLSEVKDKINDICFAHDKCYDGLFGQHSCDRKFCDDLDKYELKSALICSTGNLCSGVHWGGSIAYGTGISPGFEEEGEKSGNEENQPKRRKMNLKKGRKHEGNIFKLDFTGYDLN